MAADFSMPARTARLLVAVLALVFSVAARPRIVHPGYLPPTLEGLPPDVYSWAQPADVLVRHVDLDLTVDFDARVIRGSATLEIQNLRGVRTLVLDTNRLSIESITRDDGQPALWSMEPAGLFGAPLTIGIEPSTRRVTIHYSTTPGAAGLHWNTAEQTYGRTSPYLYTQNEAIDARSWIPLQDTPAVRLTYDATVRVPPGLLALMSAENPKETAPDGVYRFSMRTPIPSYLIALAVARLEFQAFDERSGVYAEPELISDAAHELQYLPRMIEVAEAIAGPYPWGRYDLLMMPPTYIVGGMEHPRLNFINPSSITRNHPIPALPSTLIAHELAHSWAGDLVTLATWADVWLNEGITSYLELRIIEEMSGPRRAEYEWFSDRRGFADLAQQTTSPETTILHRQTSHADHPDGFFTAAAYVKGALFMRTIEERTGRPALDQFLRDYFFKYRLRWIDDVQFLAMLQSSLPETDALPLEEWIYSPGLPPSAGAPQTSVLYDEVLARANAFRAGAPASSPASWTVVEQDLFLNLIGSAAYPRMLELESAFVLSSRSTPPLVWLTHSIRANYAPGLTAVERILMRGGPNNWMVVLYRTLAETPQGMTLARSIFEQAAPRYLDSVRSSIEQILGLDSLGASLVSEKAVGVGVLLVGLEVLGVDELPLVHVVELGKKRVSLELRVQPREVHAAGSVQRLREDLRTTGDEDLVIARRFGLADRFLQRPSHGHALG
jgi:leukotriene-A4 hydrolase